MQKLNNVRERFQRLFKYKPSPTAVDVLTGYRQWAGNYPARAHNPLMEIEEQAMLSLLPDPTGKICLDLACGSGRYVRLLQERRARRVAGLDYSAEMLAQAAPPKSEPYPEPDLHPRLIRSPFLALPFTAETFDLIVCGLAVGHEENLERLIAEAARLLRPNGVILYSDFHPFGALTGWRRTFTVNGAVFQLEHYIHLYSDHFRACQTAGLTIDAVLEPAAGPHAPPPFQETPVVLVIRAVKRE